MRRTWSAPPLGRRFGKEREDRGRGQGLEPVEGDPGVGEVPGQLKADRAVHRRPQHLGHGPRVAGPQDPGRHRRPDGLGEHLQAGPGHGQQRPPQRLLALALGPLIGGRALGRVALGRVARFRVVWLHAATVTLLLLDHNVISGPVARWRLVVGGGGCVEDRLPGERLAELVELGDPAELLRAVDGLCASRDWAGLVDLRHRLEEAVERGRPLWPVTTYVEYRLALDGPAAEAASVLRPGAARFALGPLTEVAATTHAFAELAPHLAVPAVAGAR